MSDSKQPEGGNRIADTAPPSDDQIKRNENVEGAKYMTTSSGIPVPDNQGPEQVPRIHPHAEARPEDQPQVRRDDVGLLVAVARVAAPGHDPVLGPRHARRLSPHGRLQRPHVQHVQRGRRALLGQVALQDEQGIKNLMADKAVELAGQDPDYAQRDLFEAIDNRDSPKWTVSIQVMPEAEAEPYGKRKGIDPFDVTQVWSHKDYPLQEVGVMELNQNPKNYFADIEQAAFSPANVVPGLSFSPDKMLQGRIFAYHDAHLYRVGTNYQQLPVNRPIVPVSNTQRDGAMRFDGNQGSAVNYEPNSKGTPKEAPQFAEPPMKIFGDAARYDRHDGDDPYTQPGDLFRLMTPEEQDRLTTNIAKKMESVTDGVKQRQLLHFYKADPRYGEMVAKKLGMEMKMAA